MVIDGDLAVRARAARYLISVLAERRGMTATFMPKPFTDRTGSGLHLHLSLWRDGEPLFPELDDPRGLGLSKTAYSFLAGVFEHACGLSAVIAPTVNSYKRTGAAVPLAATLAAELDDIDRGLDAGELGDATGPDLPPTLLHAVDALIADPVVAGALDAAGPGVSDYVAARQRDEFLDWHAAVSPVEVDRYLTAFQMCGIVGFGDHRRCPPGYAAVSVLGPAPAVPDAVVTRAGETTVVAAPIPLDDLPGIDRVRIWEPEPERVYAWAR